ncbi:MAG TPA: GNAT family N-acetyltransferase [Gaiellaceae bacterium]
MGALLRASWPDDPVMVEISSQHGIEFEDAEGRSRRTVVAEDHGEVVAAGSLVASARHPARLFLVIAVAPEQRRRGLGSKLLSALRDGSDGRPLQARIRETDEPGLAFLRERGFGTLMRSRTGVVDPTQAETWIASNRGGFEFERPSRKDAARLHEEAYRMEHARWSPATERPLDESLQIFCGDSWLGEDAFAAPAGIAGLHGAPMAIAADELFLIAGTSEPDEALLRALVAASLAKAKAHGKKVSIEADEANEELWRILAELPAVLESDLLVLATDCG